MDYHDFVSACGTAIRSGGGEMHYVDFIPALSTETRLGMATHFDRAQSDKLLILRVRNDEHGIPFLWIAVPDEEAI